MTGSWSFLSSIAELEKSVRFLPSKLIVKWFCTCLRFIKPLYDCFAKRERLLTDLMLEMSVANEDHGSTEEKSSTLGAFLDLAMEKSRTYWNINAHTLFFRCNGSTWPFSINFPMSGLYSCLDCFWGMKVVTLLLLFFFFFCATTLNCFS